MMFARIFPRTLAAVAMLCALGADRTRRLPPVASPPARATIDQQTPLDARHFQIALRQSLAELVTPDNPKTSANSDRATGTPSPITPSPITPSPITPSPITPNASTPNASTPNSPSSSGLNGLLPTDPKPQNTPYQTDQFSAVLQRSFDGAPREKMADLPSLPAEMPSLPAEMPSLPAEMPSLPAEMPSLQAEMPSLPAQLQSDAIVISSKTKPTETIASRLKENPRIDLSRIIPHPNASDFSQAPVDCNALMHDGGREAWVYDTKSNVPTQHPWIEWGRIWYGDGITPRGRDWFGPMNLVRPKFYLYGDYRTGIQSGRNAAGRADNWAQRLNLDMDLQITDTERFHAFVGPLDKQNRFTRYEFVDGDLHYRNEMNWTPATAFFEGDLGVMLGALGNQSSPFELPISAGLMPLLFQNGIWMEDAVSGVAFALPAKHSRLLNWANFDVSFFAVFDQLNSPAFADNSDAQAFGTAWFIEAYGGYIESGYAYLNHRSDDSLSYHNATISFTRRYFDRISNSVRVIVNAGQDREKANRTADGGLLLVENSLITAAPLTVVPYANFFYGWNRPQSVARAGISGGILRNTGINFDTDGVNGFATLDTSAADTAGGSIGVDLIGDDLDRQLLLELSYLTTHGDQAIALGEQYAVGARYQFPISNATLLRFDVMHGWRDGEENVYGTRFEYRWKF